MYAKRFVFLQQAYVTAILSLTEYVISWSDEPEEQGGSRSSSLPTNRHLRLPSHSSDTSWRTHGPPGRLSSHSSTPTHTHAVHWSLPSPTALVSVGIDLKELGGQLPKRLKFCPGIEVCGRFSLKNERLYTWTVGEFNPPPPTIPTLALVPIYHICYINI